MLRLLAVAAALLLMPGTAQAALTITNIAAPTAPLRPDVDQGEILVDVVLDCADTVPNGNVVAFEFMSPPGIVLAGPMSADVPACMTPQGQTLVAARFLASMGRDLPGLQ